MNTVDEQYLREIALCRNTFIDKNADYGTSWRVLRLPSITDQLFVKVRRIRTIEDTQINLVGESIEEEFRAIVNYSIIALIQFHSPEQIQLKDINWSEQETMKLYDSYVKEAQELMHKKNHDYGQAWVDMRVSSITDFILTKILRIKQIEDNDGKTIVSEGVVASYYDILNYAVFALILISENINTKK